MIVEPDTVCGVNGYSGIAVTTVYKPAGGVMASFTSTTSAVRMHV